MAVAVHMAKFWAEKPALWFAHLDAQFGLRGITQEDTKYHHVVAQLDVKTAQEVEDILLNPPEQNKYTRLKDELIARLSTSKQRKIKQLLEHEERGDRTPSQFLRHIRSLAGNEVPEDFIRTLWMSRLPVAMQSVLATQDGVELEKVAALADRISEVTPAQIHPAAAANNVAALGDINALVEQIAALVTTKLEGRGRQPRSSTPSSRYRRRSRPKSKAESRPSGICWYHGRFGTKATKCTKPCTFQSGNDLQSR
ncbi:uncharacterized protein LOC143360335 [Halictus rubicundus]|uniref:uncharacterized protein LOC143360335 n=1 Tax=Halictus rubicundus TaxID=77578 RepID=UPI0040367E47